MLCGFLKDASLSLESSIGNGGNCCIEMKNSKLIYLKPLSKTRVKSRA